MALRMGQESREPEYRLNAGPHNLSFLERHAPGIAWRDYIVALQASASGSRGSVVPCRGR